MLLPTKHIKVSESILGLAGIIIDILKVPMTLEELRMKLEAKHTDLSIQLPYHSFDNIILALSFLYSINTIEINSIGKLYKCD